MVYPRTELSPVKLRCPNCQSLLDVLETPSGARTVSVRNLGTMVERTARALETFQKSDDGPEIRCPACDRRFDPSEPSRAIRFLRTQRCI